MPRIELHRPGAPRTSVVDVADTYRVTVERDDGVACSEVEAATALATFCVHRLDEALARGAMAPAVVTINPANGHYHAVWWLADPVMTSPGDPVEPQRLLQRARDLLRLALDGDPGMANRLSRNPWAVWEPDDARPTGPTTLYQDALDEMASPLRHVAIDGGGDAVRLDALVASLEPWADDLAEERAAAAPKWRKPAVENPAGRNCTLFDRLRLWAYGGAVTDASLIREQAHAFNDNGLPPKEVDDTAKSVAKFMATKWVGGGRADGYHRGVMGLAGSGLPLVQRQRLAGQYGPKQRRIKTDDAVLAAAGELYRADGARPTQAALAAAAAVGLKTVKRRWAAVLAHLAATPAVATPTKPTAMPMSPPTRSADVESRRPPVPDFLVRASGLGVASKGSNAVASGYTPWHSSHGVAPSGALLTDGAGSGPGLAMSAGPASGVREPRLGATRWAGPPSVSPPAYDTAAEVEDVAAIASGPPVEPRRRLKAVAGG